MCNFADDPIIRRARLPARLSHTEQCQNAYTCACAHAAWLQRLLSFETKWLVCEPWWWFNQLSTVLCRHTLLPEHAVWIGLYQPALACFSASDYTSTPETSCYAQPKMHTVQIFCMSAQILCTASCSLFDLCDLYTSVWPALHQGFLSCAAIVGLKWWWWLKCLWSDHLTPAQCSPDVVLSLSGCNIPVPILCMI